MVWKPTLKQITEKTAFNAALLWVDKPASLKLINNQINCVYRFEYKGTGFYLRMTHEQIRPYNDLRASIDFQQHLFLNKAPICQAIPSQSGQFIERVTQDNLTFLAHVCLEVPGTVMHFDSGDQAVYTAWGKSLAHLHKASQMYESRTHNFLTWKDLWQETADYAKQDSREIQDLYQRIDSWFNKNIVTKQNYGLTHGDHRPGNVLYDGVQVYLIDFDEPVWHWFMADIARPFLDLCSQPQESWKQLFTWYIEGYRSVLPLSDEDLKTINWFIQMKSLDIYLWCKNNWFDTTAPGGKPRDQWLNELYHMAMMPGFNHG